MTATLYTFHAKRIDGTDISLQTYQGKVLLIVNTASACGFTPQYADLQALYAQYHEQGLEILAFPCNQFGAQEPGDAPTIANFCSTQFAVGFPLFSKIEVNGADAHPLYQYLKKQASGFAGTTAIKWNFTKFLVHREGEVVARFAPITKPQALAEQIEALL